MVLAVVFLPPGHAGKKVVRTLQQSDSAYRDGTFQCHVRKPFQLASVIHTMKSFYFDDHPFRFLLIHKTIFPAIMTTASPIMIQAFAVISSPFRQKGTGFSTGACKHHLNTQQIHSAFSSFILFFFPLFMMIKSVTASAAAAPPNVAIQTHGLLESPVFG